MSLASAFSRIECGAVTCTGDVAGVTPLPEATIKRDVAAATESADLLIDAGGGCGQDEPRDDDDDDDDEEEEEEVVVVVEEDEDEDEDEDEEEEGRALLFCSLNRGGLIGDEEDVCSSGPS